MKKSPTQIIAFDSLLQMPSQDNENIGSLLRNGGGYVEVSLQYETCQAQSAYSYF